MKSAIFFILLTQIASCMQLPLKTEQNNGLQYFQTMGFLIDDMVPSAPGGGNKLGASDEGSIQGGSLHQGQGREHHGNGQGRQSQPVPGNPEGSTSTKGHGASLISSAGLATTTQVPISRSLSLIHI